MARNGPATSHRPNSTASRQDSGKLRSTADCCGSSATRPTPLDPPGLRRMQPGEGAEQGGLAGPVRPDHGGQAARREASREVMHRRPPRMADGEVGQADFGGAHGDSIAQATPDQTPAATSAASANRAPAPEESARGSAGSQDMTLLHNIRRPMASAAM